MSTNLQFQVSKIQPLHDRVLVDVFEPKENTTKGGIIIPENSKEKPSIGIVAAVGHGTVTSDGKKIELSVKPGDKIIFGKYAGTEMSDHNGKKYLIMKESDILCIVE